MVLTDRQRIDLHAAIYEYLNSRSGEAFQKAADAMKEADPAACERHSGGVVATTAAANGTANDSNSSRTKSAATPLLEKKWTAVTRLSKKVLELERQVAQSAKIHAHRTGVDGGGGAGEGQRRMLPRLPATHTLAGHTLVVTCCAVHPVFTVAVSGSEDGTIKVRRQEILMRCAKPGVVGTSCRLRLIALEESAGLVVVYTERTVLHLNYCIFCRCGITRAEITFGH
jgi:platelet-activating factor acetylhydrolase IB subunit alpha